jgi:hypothetical protein
MTVVKMPIPTNHSASTISIAGMVANWTHLFGFASFPDLLTFHVSLDPNTINGFSFPGIFGLEILATFHTVRVTISVPVPAHPFMTLPSVHHGSMPMAPSVEERPNHFVDRHTVTTVMMWV